LSRGDAVKGIFYHVVTKFYHSVMLEILFGEMMANQKQEQRGAMLKERVLDSRTRHAIIKEDLLEENGVRNYQL